MKDCPRCWGKECPSLNSIEENTGAYASLCLHCQEEWVNEYYNKISEARKTNGWEKWFRIFWNTGKGKFNPSRRK